MSIGGISPSSGAYKPQEPSKKYHSETDLTISQLYFNVTNALETVKAHPSGGSFTNADKDVLVTGFSYLKDGLSDIKHPVRDIKPPVNTLGAASGAAFQQTAEASGTHLELTVAINAYNELVNHYNTVANPPTPLPTF